MNNGSIPSSWLLVPQNFEIKKKKLCNSEAQEPIDALSSLNDTDNKAYLFMIVTITFLFNLHKQHPLTH